MAETVHLYLKANGEDIQGDSTQHSLGRENSIECVFFRDRVFSQSEKGSRLATGRRQYDPIKIVKRIDKSSPLLARAMCRNEKVEGVFKFFRPSPNGDGTTEQFFAIEFKDGRIQEINRWVPDTMAPASSADPPLEEVYFVFHTIRWTYLPSGAEHEDSWSQNT